MTALIRDFSLAHVVFASKFQSRSSWKSFSSVNDLRLGLSGGCLKQGIQRKGLRGSKHARVRKIVRSMYVDDEDGTYLVDAPVSAGDGFSFTGGKYSDEEGPAERWKARGSFVNAYPVKGGLQIAKDPVFGLPMGASSQTAGNEFKWFYVEEGDQSAPPVLLLHGLPSQAYSFRNVMPVLAKEFHVIAPDWLGFGFSDKPQPKYGFNYTIDEYSAALKCLMDSLGLGKVSLVAQGYFAPAVVQFALTNQEMVDKLILINPAVTERHAKLPQALSAFANFLLGEIFAQDPLRASDRLVGEAGFYTVDEEDAMVYRQPYLTSGMSGFALTATTRALQKDLKSAMERLRAALSSPDWMRPTAIVWGNRDRWLAFNGVPDFAKQAHAKLVELPEVGHHAQEDYGEEVGSVLRTILRASS